MLCQVLIPLMKGEGRVVNVSSGSGQLADMDGGWSAYRMSKTCLNALTRILAAELKGTNVKVNAVCPGWVKTDMGGSHALRQPEDAVATAVWLATLPDTGPSGAFLRDKQPIPW
jgi:Dehydrogenases with different specificities (related to short-chain alcohol dehydrogenases)